MSLDRAWARRERPAAEKAGVTSRLTKVTVKIHTSGLGSNTVTVDFPVQFVSEPALSFGPVFAGTEDAYNAAIPIAHVNVLSWVRGDEGFEDLYVGALLGIVVAGDVGYLNPFDIQVHFEAVSFRGSV